MLFLRLMTNFFKKREILLDKEDTEVTEEEDVSLSGRKRKRKSFHDEGQKRAKSETPSLLKPSRLLTPGSAFSALTVVSTICCLHIINRLSLHFK